jgi:AraC-like DNA-binding protein
MGSARPDRLRGGGSSTAGRIRRSEGQDFRFRHGRHGDRDAQARARLLLRAAVLDAELRRRKFSRRYTNRAFTEASEMTTGVVSDGGHISRACRYQLRHKQAGRCVLCPLQAVTKNYCAKHAVASRERQRGRMKFKRRNLGAASYSFFEDEQLIAKATATVCGWMGASPAVPVSDDQKAA